MVQQSTHTEGGLPTDEAPLNIEEAAQRLGVTVRYMRRMVDEKRIRYLKVGRLVRFRGPDLDTYLRQAEVEPISTSC
ncbi:MAG: excisionase family DNA-binding protein [Acidimicrobiales bacterium]|jgi:excisionase family DNA binding protein